MKDLYVFDKPLVISEEREAYNQYRLMFIAEADAAKSRFSNLYKNCHSLDNVITYVPKYAVECIDPVITKCIKIL